jgi:hypothetical protein
VSGALRQQHRRSPHEARARAPSASMLKRARRECGTLLAPTALYMSTHDALRASGHACRRSAAAIRRSVETTTGYAQCEACPPHATALTASSFQTDCKCDPGYTGDDGGTCEACAVGKFKPEHASKFSWHEQDFEFEAPFRPTKRPAQEHDGTRPVRALPAAHVPQRHRQQLDKPVPGMLRRLRLGRGQLHHRKLQVRRRLPARRHVVLIIAIMFQVYYHINGRDFNANDVGDVAPASVCVCVARASVSLQRVSRGQVQVRRRLPAPHLL